MRVASTTPASLLSLLRCLLRIASNRKQSTRRRVLKKENRRKISSAHIHTEEVLMPRKSFIILPYTAQVLDSA